MKWSFFNPSPELLCRHCGANPRPHPFRDKVLSCNLALGVHYPRTVTGAVALLQGVGKDHASLDD